MRLNERAAVLRSEERYGEALELSEQALAIYRRLDDTHGTALTLNGLGLTQARAGDEAGALDSYETAVSLLTRIGDSHGAGRVLANLGVLHRGQGHDAQARAAWSEALERFEPGTPEHDRMAAAAQARELGLSFAGSPAASTSRAQSRRFQSGTGGSQSARGVKRERSTSCSLWM